MILGMVFAVIMAAAMPEEVSVVGLWESKETSSGGIGHAMEFRSDGTFVEATTVIVDMYYRLIGDRLVVGKEAPRPTVDTSKSPSVRVEGDLLLATGPDGSVLRRTRLPGKGRGESTIVGSWRYCHDTGAIAYERYTDTGRMFFRLPMRSSTGRYVLSGNELTLSQAQRPNTKLTVEARGDDLALSNAKGKRSEYRRESVGAWYDLEHIERCNPTPSAAKNHEP